MDEVIFHGNPALALESPDLRILIQPSRGGKTASIVHRRSGFELLAQPPQDICLPLRPGMPFGEAEAAGFDDVFPSMGVETLPDSGLVLPDHGSLWTGDMAWESIPNGLQLRLDGTDLPWHYDKKIVLEGDTVHYAYRITADRPMPCLWVCHCLMQLEPDMRFEFPGGTAVAENLIPGSLLGEAGSLHTLGQDPYDFSRPPAGGCAMKFYLRDPVPEGRCAAVYPGRGLRAEMRFDHHALPYLGFWITTGAYRGDSNFAFEPASGYYDTLECAKRRGALPILTPEEPMTFTLSLRLSELPE